MVRTLRLRNAVLLILGLLFGSFAFAAPAISTISPTAGPVSPVGSSVTINGSGFGTIQGSGTVTIGGVTSAPTSWTDTRIVAPVPSSLLSGFADVIVTVGGTASNAASFLVIPTIAGATPQSAPTGASVTITGTSFGDSQGSSTVTFQDIPVTPSAWSNTSITLQVPDAAYSGPIVVTVNGIATNGLSFDVTPTITGISPASASVGTVVTVSGTAFQPNQNFSPVTFAGVSAMSTSWSNTSFTVPVPSGATTGPVVATINNVASNGMPFIVTHPTSFYLTADASTTSGLLQLRTWGEPRPAVSYPSVDLVNHPPGDYLIQAFDTPAGVPNSSDTWQSILPVFVAVFMKQTAGTPGTLFPKFELFLNGPSGTPICTATGSTALTTAQTSYSLSCTPSADITVSPSDRYYLWVGVNSTATPITSTQFQLTIGPGGGRGSGDVFINVPLAAHIPTISGSDSQYYTAGTPFTITGTDLGGTAGTVTFNGETAVVSSWSDTSITALVPNDAYGESSTITVFNANNVQGNPWATSVLTAINNLTPASGAIGSSVVISGSGFGPSVGSVFFGGGTSGIVTNWSDTSITATVPSGATTGSVYVQPAIFAFMSNPFTFTVAQLSSLALTPSNPSVSLNSIQQLQLTATGVYSDGSSADLTSSVTWATSDRSVAIVLPTPGTRGIVGTGNAGTAIITASLAGISASTSVTVTPAVVPPVPNISSVSPATATAGTQVTVSGTGFGSSQANGSVWLGSTIGAVVTWSDTQVIANVATGSTTGIAQIQQAGISSNSLPFTVITPIISSITPTNGLAGTPVTINGTGFGTAQGTGQIWLGTAPGVVTSWSDTQIVAAVAAGSASGTAQVLQAGVVSNAVPFAVNTPSISSITPTSGVSGTSVTITGSGFGSAQGSGIVWIGSTPGLVVSWADTQVVATVDSNAVSGIVRIQQNGIWSNALSFKVPPSLGTAPSVNINPNLVSMVVGETRSLQALDDGGNVLAGLTWASTDLTVATLSTDDPPIITALAPGHVTITVGNASADLTIYPGPALPLGTVQWSIPGDGSGVAQILPAVPSDSGVDVFALQQSGNIQAVKTDGRVAWTSSVGTDKKLLPDFLGGLAVADSQSIRKLDGVTGQSLPAYNLVNPNGSVPPVLLHTDGTTFTVDGDTVVGIDPLTGNPKFNIQLENTIFSSNGNCGEFTPAEFSVPPSFGQPIIAGDGFVYFPYTYTRAPLASNMIVCNADGFIDTTHLDVHFRVLRVGTDGSATKVILGDWSQDVVIEFGRTVNSTSTSGALPDNMNQFGTLITNADQGVFYSWDLGFNGASPAHQLTTISGSSVSTISLPVPGSFQPMLQGADGTLFGTVSLPTDPSGQPGANFMIALDAVGHPKWTVPNFSPQYAVADGNVNAQPINGQMSVSFDQSGNGIGPLSLVATQSWTGNTYQIGSVESVISAPAYVDGASFWPQRGGNPSGGATAILQCPCLLESVAFATTITTPPNNPNTYLLLVGDPGLNLGPGHNHSVGDLFNMAAKTKADALNSSGNNRAITKRVSSAADFAQALTTNGIINGDITFFGHAGLDSSGNSALFVGQNAGQDTNLSILTVDQLSNVNLGQNVTITLNACHAGYRGRESVAQKIANQLKRTVFAYPVDMYFSSNSTPRHFSPSMKAPGTLPVFMVPNGDGLQPTAFRPN